MLGDPSGVEADKDDTRSFMLAFMSCRFVGISFCSTGIDEECLWGLCRTPNPKP